MSCMLRDVRCFAALHRHSVLGLSDIRIFSEKVPATPEHLGRSARAPPCSFRTPLTSTRSALSHAKSNCRPGGQARGVRTISVKINSSIASLQAPVSPQLRPNSPTDTPAQQARSLVSRPRDCQQGSSIQQPAAVALCGTAAID